MKFTVNRLKVGDTVEAIVVEQVSAGDLIVNFYGDLIRVHNQSSIGFKEGESLKLKVTTIKPLGFKLLSEIPRSVDLSI